MKGEEERWWGRREGEGEAGISQIDEEILLEERLIDKRRCEHKSGHVKKNKLEGRSQERGDPEWAACCGQDIRKDNYPLDTCAAAGHSDIHAHI